MNVLEGVRFGWRPRLPMVLQTEAAECGLACLAMVAGYLGYQIDLAELRRRFGASLRGATLKDLVRIADRLGLASRPVRLELAELKLLKTHPASCTGT
jgi:ATP-binding cassette, subfamily B, bacterial CvaB/MchF/RaxB